MQRRKKFRSIIGSNMQRAYKSLEPAPVRNALSLSVGSGAAQLGR
ncbi:hypothetical protein [Steroidobacter gossypii]|nr:hypothetical protein [Steroidobacter gossypii]